ncbi:hypothetical protein YTPLAS18_05870 [Nitrospira sp.]|nr:hypothetical protein YTPLAS18_05870 [Nitrospira sp.]
MTIRLRSILWLAAFVGVLSGCSAVRSDAVRGLIQQEGAAIDRAHTNVDVLQLQTEERIKALEQALAELTKAGQSLQQVETLHQAVFDSYQNVERKRGQDAHSAAYLLGKVYLAQYEGLQRKVLDQFNDDFCALRDVAAQLGNSWKSLSALHRQVQRYSHQSFLASVDPALVSALAEQVPGSSDHIRRVLDNSRSVNDALDEALNFSFLPEKTLGRTRSVTMDLIELLERMKKE